MEIDLEKVCSPCQIRKQIWMSQKMMQHPSTTIVLELLHMDLMRLMQVESLGGKRCVLVFFDDYSRFMWVSFFREKSDTFN